MEGLDFNSIPTFTCEGVEMPKERAVQIWKLTYKTIQEFVKEVVNGNPALNQILGYVSDNWDDAEEVTFEDCFKEKNIEIRRLLFRGIGMEVMMEKLEPELLSRETLTHPNIKWDENNKELKEASDNTEVYELYKIDGTKFKSKEELDKLNKDSWDYKRINNYESVYAVRCWCCSTGREYWIYVPERVARNNSAIEAIAWTVRLNFTEPQFIMRQGDVIIAKTSIDSKECAPYHLSATEYKNLLIAAS